MKKVILKTILTGLIISLPVFVQAKADAMQACYAATTNMKTGAAEAMEECLNMKLEQSTTLLNTSYGQVRDKLEGIDTIDNTDAIAALDESQTAFMGFREHQCKYISLLEQEDKNSNNAFLSCKIQMNDWRVDQLSKQ